MNVLGLSADFHDSAAALVQNGTLVASSTEERFSRIRHDSGFPSLATEFCLSFGCLTAQNADKVVFFEKPWVKFTRVLSSTLSEYPRSCHEFVLSMRSWLGQKLWMHNTISRSLDLHPDKIGFVEHHLSHAAQAFLTSPFERSAILVVDAIGEWSCTTIWAGCRQNPEPLRLLESQPYPHSLGLVYSAFTAFLGFQPNDGECSTMALAAFGQARFVNEVERVLRPLQDGRYVVDPTYFRFFSRGERLFSKKFTALFGSPRTPGTPLPFRCDQALSSAEASAFQRYADIAASLQYVLETALLGLARRAHRLTGAQYLCFAGGVAMNAVAVAKLIGEGPFAEIYVPIDPGDGGAAGGAALLLSHQPTAGQTTATPYLGRAYEDTAIATELAGALNLDSCRPHLLPGCASRSGPLKVSDALDLESLATNVVDDLLRGRLVALFQDRFEVGPRALGNRSILVDPANSVALQRLSRNVKQRARFRPYALAVHPNATTQLFDWQDGGPLAAQWMQTVAPVNSSAASLVAGGLHIDGTTRPQICREHNNPLLARVLDLFGQARGIAAIINTSFNEAGSPMVASPLDALLCFVRTDLDALVLQDRLIRKNVP